MAREGSSHSLRRSTNFCLPSIGRDLMNRGAKRSAPNPVPSFIVASASSKSLSSILCRSCSAFARALTSWIATTVSWVESRVFCHFVTPVCCGCCGCCGWFRHVFNSVYVPAVTTMQQSLSLSGGGSPGSQDSRRPRHPPVSDTGKTLLKQN